MYSIHQSLTKKINCQYFFFFCYTVQLIEHVYTVQLIFFCYTLVYTNMTFFYEQYTPKYNKKKIVGICNIAIISTSDVQQANGESMYVLYNQKILLIFPPIFIFPIFFFIFIFSCHLKMKN
jgi:hypothetical protein